MTHPRLRKTRHASRQRIKGFVKKLLNKTRCGRKGRKGGGNEDLEWFQMILKPRMLELFEKHNKTNLIILQFRNLYMRIQLDFDADDSISRGDFYIVKDKFNTTTRRACHLGFEQHSDREEPWPGHTFTKQIDIHGDYVFGFGCESMQGSNLTYILQYTFFYVLKLHAEYFNRPDYVITGDDQVIVDRNEAGMAIFYTDVAVQRLKDKKITDIEWIMNNPILYYERFGYIYPEKHEFFDNFIKTGEDRPQITPFYIDLSTLSKDAIESKVHELSLRI